MANFQIVFNQTLLGKYVANVTYWQLPDGLNSTLTSLAETLRADYASTVQNSLSADWSLHSITYRQMDGGGPFSTEIGFGAGPLVGLALTAALPTQVALLASLQHVGARPNRGRIYQAGLTEGGSDEQGWTPSVVTAFQDLFGPFTTGRPTTNGSAFIRIARPDFTTNTWTLNNPVDSVIVRPFSATQRRRRLG